MEREIEESKGHLINDMKVQKAWGWDLDEMRDPARMEDLNDHGSLSRLGGFTPINGHSDTALIDSDHNNTTINSATADKPRPPKRRKPQPSAVRTASKPKKATSSKQTKRAKIAAQSDCHDISQGLSRTKPTSSGHGAFRTKAKLSFEYTPSEHSRDSLRISGTPVEFKVKPAPSGLAEKYQAAYPVSQGDVVSHATPPTPPKSDKIEADLYHNDQSHDQESSTERQASPTAYIECAVQENRESDGGIIVRDFGAPPFTQMSPRTLEELDFPGTMIADKFEPLDPTSNDLFDVSDVESGNYGGEDEFPMDDQCLKEMTQSVAVQAEDESLCLDWRPQYVWDDTLCDDEPPGNIQSHWSEILPDSDGEDIYDEGSTMVVTDVIDVPSSPSRTSQASCILTRATGNVVPDRARTAEGSENCFDDQDLDDDLIDLTVDESKTLQSTSPAPPTKKPSSPKLQWLPPKTYTPAKPSQISPSPISNPHLKPSNLNRDTLPFIRPAFPNPVRDRSPIPGLSNRTVLRTCFRIGEALNAAAVASRSNVDAIIELYARVVTSSREDGGGYKQFFRFADLFTDKPPYLGGTYTFWKGVELWDVDSKGLVGELGRGKMVRVLGRIKRREPVQGQGNGVEMAVLSVWEVDWEDVEMAKGIACAEGS